MKTLPRLIALLAMPLLLPAVSFAQGNAFTYQGRLTDGPNAANGIYDLKFTVFDALTLGTPQGGPLTNAATGVSNGLFTVTLNFGAGVFSGANRWLEIQARTNGGGAFMPLTPRQPLTPSPYAIYAGGASASGLSGTIGGGQIAPGAIGTVHLSNSVSLWNRSGNNLYYTNGNVGVGTAAPQAPLHVGGAMKLDGNNTLEFGAGVVGKEVNAGKIGYQTFTLDALDIVGAGAVGDSRRVNVWDLLHIGNYGADGGPRLIAFGDADLVSIGENGEDDRLDIRAGQVYFNTGFIGLGTSAPGFPLSFADTLGDKISLFGQSGNFYGFGVQGLLLQIHTSAAGEDIAFGYGRSDAFTESMRIKGNGKVGIGTPTPQTPLHVKSLTYAFPAAQFQVANCGAACAQTDYQEVIRLWNDNGNGQAGLGFLVAAGSFNSNAVPNVWIGTHYGAAVNANDFKIATRTGTSNLTDRLYVDGATGNVGIGTNTPGSKLHVNGTVTAISFVGDGSGLTAGTNATGTIRSTGTTATFGSFNGMIEAYYGNNDRYGLAQLPNGITALYSASSFGGSSIQFGQMTGASTFAPQMTIDHGGNVGIGTTTPAWPFDVNGSMHVGSHDADGTAKLIRFGDGDYVSVGENGEDDRMELTAGMFVFSNGNVGIATTNPPTRLTVNQPGYGIEHTDGSVRLSTYVQSDGAYFGTVTPQPLYLMVNDNSGAMVIYTNNNTEFFGEITTTAVNITSDRNAKEQFKPINTRDVLDKVARLPISEWQYKTQTDARHIGPMAQDFHAAFAVGRDDKHITSVDADGVALAAIQGLNEKFDEQTREKDARIHELEKTVAELKQLVDKLAGPQTGGAR